jgi:hypothetical protein
MKKTNQDYIDMPKIIIFQKITSAKNASPRGELHLKFSDQLTEHFLVILKKIFPLERYKIALTTF